MRLITVLLFAVLWTPIWSSCPPNALTSVDNSKCFHLVSHKADFSGADETCALFGGHLASIGSYQDNEIIQYEARKKFKDANSTQFWIGANKLHDYRTWQWIDGEHFGFTNWATTDVNTAYLNCGAVTTASGYWSLLKCCDELPYVCETTIEPPTTCPVATCPTTDSCPVVTCPTCHTTVPTTPWVTTTTTEAPTTTAEVRTTTEQPTTTPEPITTTTEQPTTTTTPLELTTSVPLPPCKPYWTSFANHCYRVFEQNLEWQQAEDFCKQQGQQGHLVSIHSDAENNNFIRNLIKTNEMHWLGGYSPTGDTVTFVWSDSTPWNYNHWNVGEPTTYPLENCVVYMNKTALWNNIYCKRVLPFICKMAMQ